MTILRPFKFKPIAKNTLWGGDRIARFKGNAPTASNVGECWEISGIKGSESVVAEGDDAGLTIGQLIDKYKEDLVGDEVYARFGNEFPLLVKIIDANRDLSVQVHPHDGQQGAKNEMWYVIDTAPQSQVLLGFEHDVTPDEFSQAIAQDRTLDLVRFHHTHPGDVFFIGGGQIHSLGAGNLVAEIQQPGITTYRVSDYGRLDANGQPRELHVEQAKGSVVLTAGTDGPIAYDRAKVNEEVPVVGNQYFTVCRLVVDDTCDMSMPRPHAFKVLMNVSGHLVVTDNTGHETNLNQGEALLIPACTSLVVLDGDATVLTATIDR